MPCFERFKAKFEDLPTDIPIFPLPGALLLPGGQLPLNIFEPRYVNMILDAMRTGTRLIGMIRPKDEESMGDDCALYKTGCAGRISSFAETPDDRILITLHGVARFDLLSDDLTDRGYRQAKVDFSKYKRDFTDEPNEKIDRAVILRDLKQYLKRCKMEADWHMVEGAPDYVLVNTLAMVCPFGCQEQQALLEAPNLPERAKIISCLLNMSMHDKDCREKQ